MMRALKGHKIAVSFFSFTVFLFLWGSMPVEGLSSDAIDSSFTDEINMIKGELVTVKVYSMTRVSVTDPSTADIVDADGDELLVVGKAVGQTALFIWDDEGKRTIMLYVFNQNLDIVKNRVQKLLDSAGIHEVKLTKNDQEGKVVLSGQVPDHKRELYDQISEQFDEDIIDLVEDHINDDLVQIDMQITELNTTLSKRLGIDWTTGSASGIAPAYEETQFSSDGHIRDFFKIGHFNRTGQLIAQINALITEGKGRILSKPKLVVISGEEASFLVGGEIPIRTTTFSDTGSSQENVEFKEFGISMTVTPTIRKEKIDLIMNLEVSDIDASTATTVSEDVAFSTRSASTHLFLDNHQPIILAGLIKHQTSETVSKIPFLSDVPVFGMLFRSKANPVPGTDQELVIALTPHILSSSPKKTSPTESKRSSMAPQDVGRRTYSRQGPAPYYLGVPKEMTKYVRDVQQKISQAIVYPKEAEQYGWEGTVKVSLLVLNNGTLAFALVKESSGHDIFDEVAVNTTKRIAPFMEFPPDTDLQELNVTIPIVYSLNQN